MSSLPLATTFKWPKQLSPHSAEDWQFANSDLIPATGVMAFGKSRRTNMQTAPTPTLINRDSSGIKRHLLSSLAGDSVYVSSQHVPRLSIDAGCLAGALGEGDPYFTGIRLGCRRAVWNCRILDIPGTVPRYVPHSSFASVHPSTEDFCSPLTRSRGLVGELLLER